jgi:hypothetical protein
MHFTPELAYVGNGLKADVTSKGGTVKRLNAVARHMAPPCRVPHCDAVVTAIRLQGETLQRLNAPAA